MSEVNYPNNCRVSRWLPGSPTSIGCNENFSLRREEICLGVGRCCRRAVLTNASMLQAPLWAFGPQSIHTDLREYPPVNYGAAVSSADLNSMWQPFCVRKHIVPKVRTEPWRSLMSINRASAVRSQWFYRTGTFVWKFEICLVRGTI